MIELPTRVELQVAHSSDPLCKFTASPIQYFDRPTLGDFVKIESLDIVLSILGILHYDDGSCVVLTKPYLCVDYDDALRHLDLFKDNFEISDISSDSQPESYYILFRILISLLELSDSNPEIENKTESVKIFAESCRAILIAHKLEKAGLEFSNDNVIGLLGETNYHVEIFHRLVIEYRKERSDVDLRSIIKEWYFVIGEDETILDVGDDLCIAVGRIIFERLKCDTPRRFKHETVWDDC